jgi:hypothetical protein
VAIETGGFGSLSLAAALFQPLVRINAGLQALALSVELLGAHHRIRVRYCGPDVRESSLRPVPRRARNNFRTIESESRRLEIQYS